MSFKAFGDHKNCHSPSDLTTMADTTPRFSQALQTALGRADGVEALITDLMQMEDQPDGERYFFKMDFIRLWNIKGRGTVVKMEVTDTSGDIQISTFDGADDGCG